VSLKPAWATQAEPVSSTTMIERKEGRKKGRKEDRKEGKKRKEKRVEKVDGKAKLPIILAMF
jgi:hypothetical protein